MVDGKQDMQADGSGKKDVKSEAEATASRPLGQTGESGGGAYPNPHSGKNGSPDGPDKFFGHGGQTEIDYHGSEGGDANAAADED